LIREILENINEGDGNTGLGKAARLAMNKYLKKTLRLKGLTENYPGYEVPIGGDVERADSVVRTSFSELIDEKSKQVTPADDHGMNERILYKGAPGTGIYMIGSWKYNNRAATKIYVAFTDEDTATGSARFKDF